MKCQAESQKNDHFIKTQTSKKLSGEDLPAEIQSEKLKSGGKSTESRRKDGRQAETPPPERPIGPNHLHGTPAIKIWTKLGHLAKTRGRETLRDTGDIARKQTKPRAKGKTERLAENLTRAADLPPGIPSIEAQTEIRTLAQVKIETLALS